CAADEVVLNTAYW
nr:immunoglobulin heavy chain junction region [Macaca mulatta]MOV42229.1 immunoglobulin heavy chain junction region [Macaca mulatta]MOV43926.1 immunoglobulin heavy chain junction region [Macaca mulatta]MOV44131.1 immunoglobulin heavy chain junction region [Macaca mulatta]MOV45325.1 immunoglobulin heavy chain junction region [Macaca mulatta]